MEAVEERNSEIIVHTHSWSSEELRNYTMAINWTNDKSELGNKEFFHSLYYSHGNILMQMS